MMKVRKPHLIFGNFYYKVVGFSEVTFLRSKLVTTERGGIPVALGSTEVFTILTACAIPETKLLSLGFLVYLVPLAVVTLPN